MYKPVGTAIGVGVHACSVVSDSVTYRDYSQPGSSVHGIFQARILEWVAISFSRRSSQLRDQTRVSGVSRFVTTVPLGKPYLLRAPPNKPLHTM